MFSERNEKKCIIGTLTLAYFYLLFSLQHNILMEHIIQESAANSGRIENIQFYIITTTIIIIIIIKVIITIITMMLGFVTRMQSLIEA